MKIRHFFYFLFASLVFVACKEDDPVEPTPEITGLDFTITTYDDQPLAVGVTPTATGAESFKIYFDSDRAFFKRYFVNINWLIFNILL